MDKKYIKKLDLRIGFFIYYPVNRLLPKKPSLFLLECLIIDKGKIT